MVHGLSKIDTADQSLSHHQPVKLVGIAPVCLATPSWSFTLPCEAGFGQGRPGGLEQQQVALDPCPLLPRRAAAARRPAGRTAPARGQYTRLAGTPGRRKGRGLPGLAGEERGGMGGRGKCRGRPPAMPCRWRSGQQTGLSVAGCMDSSGLGGASCTALHSTTLHSCETLLRAALQQQTGTAPRPWAAQRQTWRPHPTTPAPGPSWRV